MSVALDSNILYNIRSMPNISSHQPFWPLTLSTLYSYRVVLEEQMERKIKGLTVDDIRLFRFLVLCYMV